MNIKDRILILLAGLALAGMPPVTAAAPPGHPERGQTVPVLVDAQPSILIRSGQTLFGVLAARGIGASTVMQLLNSGEHAHRLQRLRPGDRVQVRTDEEGALAELFLRPDVEHTYHFSRVGEGFISRLDTISLTARTRQAHGTITSTLYAAARASGLSHAVVSALAGVFAWDMDLSRDLRRGDRFRVVYEELYLDGRKVRDGDVLAAELNSHGQRLRAVRYLDPAGRLGYFTPEGHSVQKAFLRSPVEFARISSRFSLARRHPVLHRVRAHRGVDYAAPPGTPVHATADGTVRLAGSKGGYGRTVVLTHGGQRRTLYAHLSRFARGLARGSRVAQGQVIGYVGSSGLATGPHLHYEFQVNGVHRDPVTVALPQGNPVPARWRAHFEQHTAALAARLEPDAPIRLAER